MPDEPKALFKVADIDDDYHAIGDNCRVYPVSFDGESCDKELLELGNHFTDKAEAERMAAFIRKNFLFWRMALRFTDGYEFKWGEYNYYTYRNYSGFSYACHLNSKDDEIIYMTEQNAKKFAEFCNEHKEELGL
jgi:hypothetical protein